MPWASWGRGSRRIRLFPGALADPNAVALVVGFAVIELASVVEFAVIALAMADAGAGASIAATAAADAVAGCSLSWLGWSSLLCRLMAGLRSMLLSWLVSRCIDLPLHCDVARLSWHMNNGTVGDAISIDANGLFNGTIETAVQIEFDISLNFSPTSGMHNCPPNVPPNQ